MPLLVLPHPGISAPTEKPMIWHSSVSTVSFTCPIATIGTIMTKTAKILYFILKISILNSQFSILFVFLQIVQINDKHHKILYNK